MSGPSSSRRGRDGAALVIVLVLLLSLTGLVMGTMEYSTRRAIETSSLPGEYQADFMAETALAQAQQMLQFDEEEWADTPQEPWAETWQDGNLTIRITPCNAYIPIGKRPENATRLTEALEYMLDGRPDEADMVEHFFRWANSPESDGDAQNRQTFYEDRLPEYRPRNQFFAVPEEVLLVHGWRSMNATWIRDRFTVWGDRKININFAPREVFQAFFPEFASRWEAIEYWRDRRGFLDVSQIASATGVPATSDSYQETINYMTVTSNIFQAIVTVDSPACLIRKRYILQRHPMLLEKKPTLLDQSTLEVLLKSLD